MQVYRFIPWVMVLCLFYTYQLAFSEEQSPNSHTDEETSMYHVPLQDGKHVRLAGILDPAWVVSHCDIRPGLKAWFQSHQKTYSAQTPDFPLDRHGTPWGLVFLEGNQKMLQEQLLEEGLVVAFPSGVAPDAYKKMLAAEAEARENRAGIWKKCPILTTTQVVEGQPEAFYNSFLIVTGKVVSISRKKRYIYVNFNNDWRKDFTVQLSVSLLKDIPFPAIQAWQGRDIRVRGWLEPFYGPMIRVADPAQVEILE